MMGHLPPNSKMEILPVFSILNLLFLSKLEISAIFSNLNLLFLPKLEILTVFSILNSLFLSKLEILTLFSSLNKKIWETASRLDKIYFQVTHSSQIFVFFVYTNILNIKLSSLFICMYKQESKSLRIFVYTYFE